MATLIKKVLRCRHDFDVLPASYNPNERPPAAFSVSGRVICLDCGKELPRDWDQVIVPQRARPAALRPWQPSPAALQNPE